ncbi:hypothetical protein BH24ACT26_BH24ACT26_07200 [soil metagenome]
MTYGWAVALVTLVIGILVSFKSWAGGVQLTRPTEA